MKLLDMLERFLVPVVGFHCPALPIKGDNRGTGKATRVNEVNVMDPLVQNDFYNSERFQLKRNHST
jgi:hypothetical protein